MCHAHAGAHVPTPDPEGREAETCAPDLNPATERPGRRETEYFLLFFQ